MTATIRTQQLTKQYGSATVLDALDLEIEAGEVFGYLGPERRRQVDHHRDPVGVDPADIRKCAHLRPGRLGRRGDDPSPPGPRAERSEPVAVAHRRGGAASSSRRSTAPSTTRYRAELVDRFELALDKKVRAYSHGNRQKVMLIAAFASRADVLLLDEPTTGLDPLMEQTFRACVREARDRGQTVLLSSHILSEVEVLCDRVAMLRAGRIIEIGRLDDLRGLLAGPRARAARRAAAGPVGHRWA